MTTLCYGCDRHPGYFTIQTASKDVLVCADCCKNYDAETALEAAGAEESETAAHYAYLERD